MIGIEFKVWTVSDTSGRCRPGLGENCDSNVSASSSTLWLADNAIPFGPFSG